MDEIVKEFLSESFETVDQLTREVARMRDGQTDHETIVRAYRSVHTVKGSCGFLGLSRLEAVTTSGELVLSHLQNGKIELSEAVLPVLDELAESIRDHLVAIRDTGRESGRADQELIGRLDALVR